MRSDGFYWIRIWHYKSYKKTTIGYYLQKENAWEVPMSDVYYYDEEVEVLKFIGETYVA